VDILEFVDGMLRLKGEAKSSDVHMLMHHSRKVVNLVSEFMDELDTRLPLSFGPVANSNSSPDSPTGTGPKPELKSSPSMKATMSFKRDYRNPAAEAAIAQHENAKRSVFMGTMANVFG